jgi:hypothetical protein
MITKTIYEIGDVFEKDNEFFILIGFEDKIFQQLVSLKDCKIWGKSMTQNDMAIEIGKYNFKYLGKSKDLLKIEKE